MTRTETARYLLTHPAEFGRYLGYEKLTDELHGEWMRMMITEDSDMTLQAHRSSYKTTCLTIVLAMLMILQRSKNIIFIRKTDGDIAEVVSQVRRILESPLTQQVYSALTGESLSLFVSTKNEITTSAYNAPRGATQLLGIGLGGSLTGKHADIIVTDDIVNRLDRVSKAQRDKTKAVYQELQNIKIRGGRIINTGTPWHKEDAFTLMPKPIVYDCYSTGLMTQEEIEKLRRSMTPSLFAANYEMRHIAEENALFTDAPVFQKNPDMLRDGFAHVDAAYGGEDYTAFTCGIRIGDKMHMYGRIWRCHVDSCFDAIINECMRLKVAPVFCESNGDKGYLAREFVRRGVPAKRYTENQNKYTKISTYLRKWWSNIIWLQGTDSEYINQILDYTEQAEHDDAPDSCACLCRLLDRT